MDSGDVRSDPDDGTWMRSEVAGIPASDPAESDPSPGLAPGTVHTIDPTRRWH